MLNANDAFLVESLYNKMRVMLSEYRAFDPKVTKSEKGKNLFEKLIKIHNKLAFIALTNDKQLLTITGEQGSGKTTLVNRLYELEPGYLPENDSRGEQLPVLITKKKGVSKPELITQFQKLYEKHLAEVRKEIIKSLSYRKEQARRSFEEYVSENINLKTNKQLIKEVMKHEHRFAY